jgi:hypothetical protein
MAGSRRGVGAAWTVGVNLKLQPGLGFPGTSPGRHRTLESFLTINLEANRPGVEIHMSSSCTQKIPVKREPWVENCGLEEEVTLLSSLLP